MGGLVMTFEIPEEGGKDNIIEAGKRTIELLPGGPEIVKILEMFYKTPFEKSKIKFQHDICAALNMLTKKGYVIDQLKDDFEFLEIIHHATRIAIASFKEEKRLALKNAIINAAQHNAPAFAMQQIFLNHIERFTEWHIRLLKFCSNPQNWFASQGRNPAENGLSGIGLSFRDHLETAYGELRFQKHLVNAIWVDLYNADLLKGNKDMLDQMVIVNETLVPKTTPLGEELIKYISG